MPPNEQRRPGQGAAPESPGETTKADGTATKLDIGIALRDEGRDRAVAGASGLWHSAAWSDIEVRAGSGVEFTSDDVRDEVGDPIGNGSFNAWCSR